MEVARLYESPFTDRAPTGPDYLFTDPEVDAMILVLDDVRKHALAEDEPFADEAREVAR
jgi:type I restriction enzyme R subunit